MLIRGVVSLVGLGLVMGFSPTLYAMLLYLLSHARHPWRSAGWLSAGVVLACTVLLAAFHSFAPAVISTFLRHRVDEVLVHRSIDMAVGVLFLAAAGGVALAHYRRRAGHKPRRRRKPAPKSRAEFSTRPLHLVTYGFIDIGASLSSMATMYITARVITSTSRHLVLDAGLYTIFLAAVVGPLLLLVLAWKQFPRTAGRIASWVRWLTCRDLRPLLAVALAAAGGVFVYFGIAGY